MGRTTIFGSKRRGRLGFRFFNRSHFTHALAVEPNQLCERCGYVIFLRLIYSVCVSIWFERRNKKTFATIWWHFMVESIPFFASTKNKPTKTQTKRNIQTIAKLIKIKMMANRYGIFSHTKQQHLNPRHTHINIYIFKSLANRNVSVIYKLIQPKQYTHVCYNNLECNVWTPSQV